MKKKILAIALSLTLLMGGAITAFAQQEHPTVTFNQNKTLEYGNVEESEDGRVSLGNAFEAVLPGESRSQVITLKNNNAQTVDFYMSADVVQSLEEANKASGAAYEIELTAGGNVLYDSTLGGYDAASKGSADGLANMNSSLSGDVFVATLKQGESADVILTIHFDGEAMDNTAASDYSDALGALDFRFKAGYEEAENQQVVDKVVVRKGETVYEKKVVEIVDEGTPLAVKTGDNTMVAAALAVLAAGIVLFFLTGKRKEKNGVGVFAAALLCTALWSGEVEAAGTYTVTYRPGNVGNFALAGTSQTDVRAMAEEAAAAMGYAYDYEVTENGAIKLFVPRGESIPVAPSYIVTKESYFAKSATVWGPAQGEIVEKNIDFVVDYGKLVDGVEYIIQYLDKEAETSVAPIAIAYGNIGAEEVAVAPERITGSGVSYVREGAATQTLILGEDAAKNVITFYYTAQPTGNITENVIYQDVPGETVVETEYVVVPGQNAGAVLAPGQGATIIPDENIPLAPTPNLPAQEDVQQGGADTPQAEDGQQAGEEQQPQQPAVEIPEEDVPLASAPEESSSEAAEVVEIEDEDTPMAEAPTVEGSGNGIFIGFGAVLALLAAVGAVWLKTMKRARAEEAAKEE